MARAKMLYPFLFSLLLSACGTMSVQLEYAPSPIMKAGTPTAAAETPGIIPQPLAPALTSTPGRPGFLYEHQLPSFFQISTVVTPTAGPGPGSPPVTSATPVRFGQGVTSVGVGDVMPAPGFIDYVVTAEQGQMLVVQVQSAVNDAANGPVSVGIINMADGQLLGWQPLSWKGILPARGDYLIRLSGGQAFAHFFLYVSMPIRVSLPPGGGATSLDGILGPQGDVVDMTFFPLYSGAYIVDGKRGQHLNVTVTSLKNMAFLNIIRDGDIYQVQGDVSTGRHFEGALPFDGLYWVMPIDATNETIPYQLQIMLSP